MAWTTATFKARWTEFAPVADAKVQAALDAAVLTVDDRLFGARTDEAVGLLAAHKLAISPQGATSRLVPDKGKPAATAATTTYGVDYERLVALSAGGGWAIGQRASS